jgi:hypothetical protein
MVDLPEYLRERPTPAEYAPLVHPRLLLLPFREIPWEHFEGLSLELFERRTRLQRLTVAGDTQLAGSCPLPSHPALNRLDDPSPPRWSERGVTVIVHPSPPLL